MDRIIIVDAMGALTQMTEDVVSRHLTYAQILDEDTKSVTGLVIISPAQKEETLQYSKSLKQFTIRARRRFSIRFLRGAVRIIRNIDSKDLVLIAADPWESYISCRIIALFSKPKKVHVQVQLHADIGDHNWRHFRKLFFLRSEIARFLIPHANSLRLVSQIQYKNLKERKFRFPDNTFIAAVPLNLKTNFVPVDQRIHEKELVIGFVGRIEADRGLQTFIDFVQLLKVKGVDFRILVVGEGCLEKDFMEKLSSLISSANIKLGYARSSMEMSKFWSEISVLISTAPAESYGRSIREALVHGVPVLAIPSSGAKEVARLTSSIRFIQTDLPEKTIANFNWLLRHGVDRQSKERILNLNDNMSRALVSNWKNLLFRKP